MVNEPLAALPGGGEQQRAPAIFLARLP